MATQTRLWRLVNMAAIAAAGTALVFFVAGRHGAALVLGVGALLLFAVPLGGGE